jgi:cytochrome c553
MKTGNRKGTGVALMKPVVDNLSLSDMIAVSAFLGTLP